MAKLRRRRRSGRHSYGRRPAPTPAQGREPVEDGHQELDEALGLGAAPPAGTESAPPARTEPAPPTAPAPPGAEPARSPRRGARRAALQERKWEARRSMALRGAGLALMVLVALAIAAAAVVVLSEEDDGGPGATGGAPTITAEGGDAAVTTLVYGTGEGSEGAAWLALLSYDVEGRRGAVVYIPADTAAEVPGRGPQGIGDSLASGGPALLRVSAENLLDVRVDRYLQLSGQDVEGLLSAIGPITVDVPVEVRVSAGEDQERVLFSEGLQELSPSLATQLLFTVGMEGDDAELGARHLAFWAALFEEFEGRSEALTESLRRAEGALDRSDASPAENAGMLEALAALGRGDRTLALLPVTQVGAGDDELFRVDRDELSELMARILGRDAQLEEVRVQVLNGNGEPGVGAQVARRLVGKGYRVVLSGNALSLDHKRTKIVTYDDSPEGLGAARRAKELVGVGKVAVSSSEQDIVDLTIVVGRDFLREK